MKPAAYLIFGLLTLVIIGCKNKEASSEITVEIQGDSVTRCSLQDKGEIITVEGTETNYLFEDSTGARLIILQNEGKQYRYFPIQEIWVKSKYEIDGQLALSHAKSIEEIAKDPAAICKDVPFNASKYAVSEEGVVNEELLAQLP